MADDPLGMWRDGAVKSAIVAFVGRVTEAGADFVPPDERVAVFDNDGTLWCEKPMPIQVDFIMRFLAESAEKMPELRERQPWKAAFTKDYRWLGDTIVQHYHGDESGVKLLVGALQKSFGGMDVEEYDRRSEEFLETAQHPTLKRPYRECTYAPMRELLDYLDENGFTNYIASGGDRDFMRPVTDRLYGIDRERVIGSTFGLKYEDGRVLYTPTLDIFDDGPAKPARIWSRVGRRPIFVGGNSNGDIEMFEYARGTSHGPMRLLVLHDDATREFAYEAGAERAIEKARPQGALVVSMAKDWDRVFPAPIV